MEGPASVASSSAAQTSGSNGTSDLADLAPATIAGIVLGVLGMCCVIIVIGFALYLRRTRQKRGKLAGVPMPSPVCQTPTTAPIMVPEQDQRPCPMSDPRSASESNSESDFMHVTMFSRKSIRLHSTTRISPVSRSCRDTLEQQIRASWSGLRRSKSSQMSTC